MAEKIDLSALDLSVYTTDELVSFSRRIDTEYQRKYTLENIPAQIDEQIKQYQNASGTAKTAGSVWIQPTGALDAYPKGAEVTVDGKTYVSQIPANVWKPAETSRWWKEKTPATTPSGNPVWDGSGHTYKVGENVTYKGMTYRVLQTHTSQPDWAPDAVASLYTKL